MAIDIEALTAPLDGEDPAGPDLSYENDRTVIEAAFSSEGDEQPAWSDIIARIADQAKDTRDLTLGILWMRAATKLGDLARLETAARYTAVLAEANWAHMHPKLDEYGFQGRKGVCESLARISDFLGPLRRTILVEHPRLGSYSGGDIERFVSEGEAAEGYGMFRAALAETEAADIDAGVASLRSVRESIKRLERVLDDNAEGDTGTNFEATFEVLDALIEALSQFGTQPEEPVPEAAEETVSGGGGSGGARLGAVDNRDEVVKALDAICDYYRRREPGSPIPVLLDRARRLVHLDFMELLEDLLPDSVSDAEKIMKSRRRDGSDD